MGKEPVHIQNQKLRSMGPSIDHSDHRKTHNTFLLCNYVLIGAASSCIFLTIFLRLVPSPVGFAVILLHALTIDCVVSGCTVTTAASNNFHAAHMVASVLTAIFQGSVVVLIFTGTSNFLRNLKSYVREDDGTVILKLVGGLCVLMFWVALTLAFVLRYYVFSGENVVVLGVPRRSDKGREDELKDWPWPFQV